MRSSTTAMCLSHDMPPGRSAHGSSSLSSREQHGNLSALSPRCTHASQAYRMPHKDTPHRSWAERSGHCRQANGRQKSSHSQSAGLRWPAGAARKPSQAPGTPAVRMLGLHSAHCYSCHAPVSRCCMGPGTITAWCLVLSITKRQLVDKLDRLHLRQHAVAGSEAPPCVGESGRCKS